MFVVVFHRKDFQPNEEYYYLKLEDAEYHASLFECDTSNLYDSIEILDMETPF